MLQPLYIGRLIAFMHSKVNRLDEPPVLSIHTWWRLVVVYVLYGLAVAGGMALLIIPGIVIAIRLGFAEFEAVLSDETPWSCLRRSWQTSKPCFWQLLGGSLLLGGCSLLLVGLIPSAENLTGAGQVVAGSLTTLVSTLLTILMTMFFFRVYDGVLSERAEVVTGE